MHWASPDTYTDVMQEGGMCDGHPTHELLPLQDEARAQAANPILKGGDRKIEEICNVT